MGLINDRFEGTYASINAKGVISVTVPEGTQGAKFVEYEFKRNGELVKGSKWVKEFNKISGFITDVKFFDGNFGEQINISIKDETGDIILTMPLGSNYSQDIMKKLPNIDLSKKVIFAPYSFEDDKKKRRKGVTVYQDGNKILSFFSDAENKPINDFPVVPKENDKMKTKDWTIYFMEVSDFLKNYVETNLLDKIEKATQSNLITFDEEKVDEMSVDDIPFINPDEAFDDPAPKEEIK